MPEIGDLEFEIAEDAAHGCQFLVRHFQEIFEKSQFMQQLQRRGMHGVAAKVAALLFTDT